MGSPRNYLANRQHARALEWALKATPRQKNAALSVRFFLWLNSYLGLKNGEIRTISTRDLHRHFAKFSWEMGLKGAFYHIRQEKCRAVIFYASLCGFENPESDVWNEFPVPMGTDLAENEQILIREARRIGLTLAFPDICAVCNIIYDQMKKSRGAGATPAMNPR